MLNLMFTDTNVIASANGQEFSQKIIVFLLFLVSCSTVLNFLFYLSLLFWRVLVGMIKGINIDEIS